MSRSRSVGGRVPLGPGGEFDLIRKLLGPDVDLPEGVLLGPGDDCAVLEGGLVISTDLAMEGVHFRREWITLEEAGFRAAAAGLSDMAAMAAEPLGALLSIASDPSRGPEEVMALHAGAEEACEREGIQIIGGDLSRSTGPIVLNIVALGRTGSPVLRAGTQVGDELWVTGRLGGSGAAVALWKQGKTPAASLREAFARPRPRIREALWLADRVLIHGLIDLSDGLAGDAGHLASASGLSLVLREGAVPSHTALADLPGAKDSPPPSSLSPLHFSLQGGEDYELCFSVAPGSLDDWLVPFQDAFGLPLTKVGRAEEGSGVFLESGEGELRPVGRGGFNHFSAEEER